MPSGEVTSTLGELNCSASPNCTVVMPSLWTDRYFIDSWMNGTKIPPCRQKSFHFMPALEVNSSVKPRPMLCSSSAGRPSM